MAFEAWGVQDGFYLQISQLSTLAQLLIAGYGLVLIAILLKDRRQWPPPISQRAMAFALAALLAAALSQLLLIHLDPPYLLPPPSLPEAPKGATIPLLSGAFILLSGAYFGVGPALVIGFASGLARAGWGSYRLFEPFEVAFMVALAVYLLRQRYRGQVMNALRQPLVAGPLSAALIWPLRFPGFLLQAPDPSLASVDYAVAQMGPALTAAVGEMLVGGLVIQLVYRWRPALRPAADLPCDKPTPWQTSLSRRLFFGILPITLLGALFIVSAVMVVGVNVSTDMVVAQIARDANNAATAIPFFIHTGASLLHDLADSLSAPDVEINTALREGTRIVPFFAQILYYEQADRAAYQHPDPPEGRPSITPGERDLVDLTLNTGMPHDAALFPIEGYGLVVSFVAPVRNGGDVDGAVVGALLGRTALDANPITEPVLENLRSVAGGRGEGFVIDKDYQIILHPDRPDRVMGQFTLGHGDTRITSVGNGIAYRRQARDGELQLAYLQEVEGTEWSVVIITPHVIVLEQAVKIAAPLATLLAVVSALTLALTYNLAARTARPITQLAATADRIAGGDLTHPIPIAGRDEVGRLGNSFEHMRANLKDRLDEQALLLQISQTVSTGFSLTSTLPPILRGCLEVTGAAGVRVALTDRSSTPAQPPTAYAVAADGDDAVADMAALDQRLLDLVEAQGRLIIEYLSRAAQPIVDTSALKEPLEALIALPLRHKETYLGVLWLGYREAHRFTEAEQTFLETLAGQATMTVARARLYEAASRGREQLEIILTSTADAVLVTDHHHTLLMVNPAAGALLEIEPEAAEGQPVETSIKQPELLSLLQSQAAESEVGEVVGENKRTYSAIASPILTPAQEVAGRVVVLHDITHLKEIEAMKDDFVQIVSHDLRSPLTYMRGYATMLGMVGPLNEKQQGFTDKIVIGIEQMSNLIENVLNIGRLESPGELERTPCDVADMIDGVVDDSRAQAITKEITLSVHTDPSLPIVMADEHLLRQAITNLIDNAIKYTPQSGAVTVNAGLDTNRPGRPHIVVSVADNGPGISASDQEHLFEKFYRVRKKGNIKVKGSGLGLTIVKGVAQRHGGDAWVESELGKGTTFYLSFEAVPPGSTRDDTKLPSPDGGLPQS